MSIAVVSQGFPSGYRSDEPRDQLPHGAAYRMKDLIPQLNAPLDKRGGWGLASTSLTTLSVCTRAAALAWLPFPDDPHLVVVADNGKVYNDKTFDVNAGAFISFTPLAAPTSAPVWHNSGKIAVILQALGAAAAAPQKYFDAGGHAYQVTTLGGTPPQASVGASWGDYLLLANGYVAATRFSNRIWVSGVGAPESWTPGTNFFDMPAEVVFIAPMRTFILVFGYSDVWMLSGDTPPPGGNWSRSTIFSGIGCMDGRSVVTYQSFAIWANNSGIYKTDGYSLSDLTDRGGIKQRWIELVGNFDFLAGWSASAGIYSGHYFIVVYDQNGNFVTCQVCDLEREIWFEFSNVPAAMFAQRASGPGTATVTGDEELFFAHRTLPLIGAMSSCWSPSSANASDGDGVAVLPQLETPFWKFGSPNKKQVRKAFATYDLRSSGAAPYLQTEVTTSPEENAPYTLLSGQLPATTQVSRLSFPVRQRGYGVGLRLTQVGASAQTRLEEIEADVQVLEAVR